MLVFWIFILLYQLYIPNYFTNVCPKVLTWSWLAQFFNGESFRVSTPQAGCAYQQPLCLGSREGWKLTQSRQRFNLRGYPTCQGPKEHGWVCWARKDMGKTWSRRSIIGVTYHRVVCSSPAEHSAVVLSSEWWWVMGKEQARRILKQSGRKHTW